MSLLERWFSDSKLQQIPVIRITREDYIQRFSTGLLHGAYLRYWKLSTRSERLRMLLLTTVSLLTLYVVSPSIAWYLTSEEDRKKMFSSKRADKYTTGLINTRNDCFANSSIQAFASLPELTIYLNEIYSDQSLISCLPLPHTDDDQNEVPRLRLHEALAKIVKQLQEPIKSKKYISVWPLLHVIEAIFNLKISQNQNDAQELVQLIVETLGNEHKKLKKYVAKNALNVTVPDFPFDGLAADQLTCYSCLNSSRPSFHPFSMLSLSVPQETRATLYNMIRSNELQTINGYHCLRCKVKAILKVEDEKMDKNVALDEEQSHIISRLKILEPSLTINDDLEEPLNSFVKNYKFEGFATENLLSTIVKKTLIIRPPSLLTIHLSRSVFVSNHIQRNGCNVIFPDLLDIQVDKALASEYESRKRATKKTSRIRMHGESHSDLNSVQDDTANIADDIDDELEGYDDDRHEPVELKKIHSKILTEHNEESNDKEGSEHVDHVETTDSLEGDGAGIHKTGSSTEESLHSQDGAGEEGSLTSDDDEVTEELNARKGNPRYRLKAMVRQNGTHNAGHYECYRHKPELVKDKETGNVINRSPTIHWGEEPSQSASSSQPPSPVVQSKPHSVLQQAFSESISRGSADGLDSDDDSHFSRFKTRLGGLVSRRSSLSSSPSTTSRRNVSSTPTNNLDELCESTGSLGINHPPSSPCQQPQDPTSFKKISTVTKYPFWRISDSTVTEARKDDVLKENWAVYMLFYEIVRD